MKVQKYVHILLIFVRCSIAFSLSSTSKSYTVYGTHIDPIVQFCCFFLSSRDIDTIFPKH